MTLKFGFEKLNKTAFLAIPPDIETQYNECRRRRIVKLVWILLFTLLFTALLVNTITLTVPKLSNDKLNVVYLVGGIIGVVLLFLNIIKMKHYSLVMCYCLRSKEFENFSKEVERDINKGIKGGKTFANLDSVSLLPWFTMAAEELSNLWAIINESKELDLDEVSTALQFTNTFKCFKIKILK